MKNNKGTGKKISGKEREMEKNVNRELSSREMEEVTGGAAYQMPGRKWKPRY